MIKLTDYILVEAKKVSKGQSYRVYSGSEKLGQPFSYKDHLSLQN